MEDHKNKQFKALVIALVIFILGAIAVYFLFFNNRDNKDNRKPIDIEDKIKSKLLDDLNAKRNIKYAEPMVIEFKEMTHRDIEKFVTSFTERYGSYSNQANFDNIMILESSMTDGMRTWAKDYVDEQRARKISNSVYYGVITKAVGVNVIDIDIDGGVANFLVETRRRESFESKSGSDNVFNQSIEVRAVKSGKTWKIDKAFWGDRSK